MESKVRNGNGLDAKTRRLADRVVRRLKEELGIDLLDAEAKLELKDIPFELLSEVRAALATSKIPSLLSLIEDYEESEEPVVVFSDHVAPVKALGEREGWAVILGETSPEARQEAVNRFQAGELKGIAGTIKAMGVGLTLTRAHHVVFNDLNWTPALNVQAEDRVCRIGQTRGVIVTWLVADHPLERRIHELLTEKQRVIAASVEASSVEEDYLGTDPASDLVRAAEKAKALVRTEEELERERERQERERERERQERERERELKRIALERLRDAEIPHDGREIVVRGKTRSAANPVEEWAAKGLVQLQEDDSDRASERNSAGFSKLDTSFGHSLANQIRESGLLTDRQWVAAVKLARKYRRQLPKEPKL